MGGVRMAKRKGPKKTNRYPEEFKIKAVQLADHPDILAKNVAEVFFLLTRPLMGDPDSRQLVSQS